MDDDVLMKTARVTHVGWSPRPRLAARDHTLGADPTQRWQERRGRGAARAWHTRAPDGQPAGAECCCALPVDTPRAQKQWQSLLCFPQLRVVGRL